MEGCIIIYLLLCLIVLLACIGGAADEGDMGKQ